MIFFWVVWAIGVILVLAFGAVILIGAPYMPTLKSSCQQALDLLELKTGQTLYDLGCGDGVMLKLAAQSGLKAVGYEINPFLVIIAKIRTFNYRHQVSVRWGNFWQADLSQADGIFVFLLDRYMSRLDRKLNKQTKKGTRLVSHAFKIPAKKAVKKVDALFLYQY